MNLKTSLLALSVMCGIAILGSPAVMAKSQNDQEPKHEIVTVKAGDTLTKIADKYDMTYVRLFNANKDIANPNVIDVGDKVRVPKKDEKLPNRYDSMQAARNAAAAVAAPQQTSYTTQGYTSEPVNSSSYYAGNGMWCTDYVHSKRPDVAVYGNAGYNWVSSAQAAGKSTGSAPKAGAVAVTNGHVAYVESVNNDGSYVVSETGWNYQAGNYNERTVSPGSFGKFIY